VHLTERIKHEKFQDMEKFSKNKSNAFNYQYCIVEKIEWIQHSNQIKVRITTFETIQLGGWSMFLNENGTSLIFQTKKGDFEIQLHDQIEKDYQYIPTKKLTRNLIFIITPRNKEKTWSSLTKNSNNKVIPWFDLFSENDDSN